MSAFKGQIRDEIKNQQFSADLLIQSGYWIIRYKDQAGHIQQLTWPEKSIHHTKDSFDSTRYTSTSSSFAFTSSDKALLTRMNPKTWVQKWINKNPALPSIFTGLSLFVLGVWILWNLLPILSSKIAGSISIENEKKLGRKMADAFLQNEKIDDTLSLLLNQYYQALDKKSLYDIKIHAISSDVANAFAIPGGTIAVYTGLLNKMKSHESLAALLGHESTHIEHRHSLKAITRNLALGATLNLLLGGYDITSVLVANASKLSGLKYSRSLEEDADNGSINFLLEKNISLQGMIDLMETLHSTHGTDDHIEILQTHPLTDNRIFNAKEEFAQQKQKDPHPELDAIWQKINLKMKG